MSKILQHTWIKKTKKTHRCMWCAQVIEAGSAATYNAIIFDGEFSAYHMHPECEAAKDSLTREQWESMGYCFDFGKFSRGRADGEKLPPVFSAGYRGKEL